MAREMATFGAGCFWCIEHAFEQLNGVISAKSGYAGGKTKQPSYHSVCTGETGHAEVVQIDFDNHIISYQTLLSVFFSLHDPTQLNRQGNDIGTQYRSIIFYHSPLQHQQAKQMINALQFKFALPIVTQIESESPFYSAEENHQGYVKNTPNNPYCQTVILPKIKKFRQKYAKYLK